MHVVKTLTKSLREFKKETILSPVLVTVEVVVECLIPLYMVTMLEKIEADNSIENILFWGGLLLLMAAVACAGAAAGGAGSLFGCGMAKPPVPCYALQTYAGTGGFMPANPVKQEILLKKIMQVRLFQVQSPKQELLKIRERL